MKTKAKGDGKRRKRENTVKKWQQCSFISPYLWLSFNNKVSTTLRIKKHIII